MIKKISMILLIILLSITFFSSYPNVQATSISNMISGAQEFIDTGKSDAKNAIDMEQLSNVSDIIYNVLLIIGTCVAVIIATVLGIQFITGSVEQKVKVKESLIPFIVGCAVLFGAFGIWRLVIILIR